MANELNIALAKSGLTVTAQRYQAGAAVGSAISCPETGSTGFYSGNMTGTAGTYQVAFISASANVGSGSIVWDGTAEVAPSTLTAPQVRTELSTELGRIDATISSRLAPSGTLATVTTLTNAPTVPTAAAIATQVRSELATELARVDAGVSTRLATSGYTAPSTAPTAAANASAVRTELATELARVDVATSTRLASSAYTAPSNSDVTAIKAKTDLLETTRLAQCSTVATTGAQLAAALS
jgi:hypothetical protein